MIIGREMRSMKDIMRKGFYAFALLITGAGAASAQSGKTGAADTIYVYRYNEFPAAMLNEAVKELRTVYPWVKMAGRLALPGYACHREPGKVCYTSMMLLNQLRRVQRSGVVIGFTDKAICYKKEQAEHYRCMGYSGNIGGKFSVVTTERFRQKKDRQAYLNRVMLHELGHAFGLRHCKDGHCIMVAAEGGNKFGTATAFCKECSAFLKGKGWLLK